jgi:hypothetical protein
MKGFFVLNVATRGQHAHFASCCYSFRIPAWRAVTWVPLALDATVGLISNSAPIFINRIHCGITFYSKRALLNKQTDDFRISPFFTQQERLLLVHNSQQLSLSWIKWLQSTPLKSIFKTHFNSVVGKGNRLCGPVIRVSGYRSRGPVRFPALPDFLKSSGSGTGSTQPREYSWGATWKKT